MTTEERNRLLNHLRQLSGQVAHDTVQGFVIVFVHQNGLRSDLSMFSPSYTDAILQHLDAVLFKLKALIYLGRPAAPPAGTNNPTGPRREGTDDNQ